MRAFVQAERFVSELESRKLRAAYIFVGDEAFFRKRLAEGIFNSEEHVMPSCPQAETQTQKRIKIATYTNC